MDFYQAAAQNGTRMRSENAARALGRIAAAKDMISRLERFAKVPA